MLGLITGEEPVLVLDSIQRRSRDDRDKEKAKRVKRGNRVSKGSMLPVVRSRHKR
jgi:hypothetical protein